MLCRWRSSSWWRYQISWISIQEGGTSQSRTYSISSKNELIKRLLIVSYMMRIDLIWFFRIFVFRYSRKPYVNWNIHDFHWIYPNFWYPPPSSPPEQSLKYILNFVSSHRQNQCMSSLFIASHVALRALTAFLQMLVKLLQFKSS